ncbi:MAG: hypothetical protein KDC87_14325 [Planctomycetes bacterium]|nr:hypothetical protein [Planctomycetota bacterium]MCB9871306.1 hypothetical protein [Planctomycetota bacterium]
MHGAPLTPVLAFAVLVSTAAVGAQGVRPLVKAPRELGRVPFSRDLDAVLRGRPTKPVFLLFQEVPG